MRFRRFFSRPYGTILFLTQIPSHEWLGYYQSSLRDYFVSDPNSQP